MFINMDREGRKFIISYDNYYGSQMDFNNKLKSIPFFKRWIESSYKKEDVFTFICDEDIFPNNDYLIIIEIYLKYKLLDYVYNDDNNINIILSLHSEDIILMVENVIEYFNDGDVNYKDIKEILEIIYEKYKLEDLASDDYFWILLSKTPEIFSYQWKEHKYRVGLSDDIPKLKLLRTNNIILDDYSKYEKYCLFNGIIEGDINNESYNYFYNTVHNREMSFNIKINDYFVSPIQYNRHFLDDT